MSVNILTERGLQRIAGNAPGAVEELVSGLRNDISNVEEIARKNENLLQNALLPKGALHAVNIDTLFTVGIWKTTADGTGTYPTGSKTGTLISLNANEYYIQIFFAYAGDMYTRTYAGSWYNWHKIKFEN